jgi:hypothetical protein
VSQPTLVYSPELDCQLNGNGRGKRILRSGRLHGYHERNRLSLVLGDTFSHSDLPAQLPLNSRSRKSTMRRIILLAVMLSAMLCCATTSAEEAVKITHDTDMCTDCDDAGAFALLNRLADLGEMEILAVVVNGTDRDDATGAVADAINT